MIDFVLTAVFVCFNLLNLFRFGECRMSTTDVAKSVSDGGESAEAAILELEQKEIGFI